jgi:hypothetical protein
VLHFGARFGWASLAFFACRLFLRFAAPRAPSPRRPSSAVELPAALRPAVAVAVGNALLAAPALAEPGKIFDFNLTLPLMAGQFLLLMIILDKLVYTPVGKVLDDRDAVLRSKLEAVKDNSGDLLKFTVRARQAKVRRLWRREQPGSEPGCSRGRCSAPWRWGKRVAAAWQLPR